MGRQSREQLEKQRQQAAKARYNKNYNGSRYHVAANLPAEWREIVEEIAREDGYVYNGSVTVGGYIKALVEADLIRRGKI